MADVADAISAIADGKNAAVGIDAFVKVDPDTAVDHALARYLQEHLPESIWEIYP